MGYFCVSKSDSVQDRLKAALGNIDLFKKSKDSDDDYLPDLVEMYIKEVLKDIGS